MADLSVESQALVDLMLAACRVVELARPHSKKDQRLYAQIIEYHGVLERAIELWDPIITKQPHA